MKRKPIRLLVAVAAVALVGFGVAALSSGGDPSFSVDTHHGRVKLAKGQERRILNAVENATTQTPKDDLVAAGRRIFRNPALFEDGESCQTCHAEGSASPELGTMTHDTKATNPKINAMTDFDGPRDVPSLWDIAKTAPYFWDGDVGTLQAALLRPVMGHMKKFQEDDCKPPASDQAACDKAAGDLVAQLTAYLQTLQPPTTAFDEGTMSEAALRGEKIFQGKGGCIECHGGPQFTDNLAHNTGVPQVTFTSPYGTSTSVSHDLGCQNPRKPGGPPTECLVAAPECAPAPGQPAPAGCDAVATPGSALINTPQLRDLKDTAPYMHNGAFKTLAQVVRFYNGPGLSTDMPTNTEPHPANSNLAPLGLTDQEASDLVAYLESL